MNSRAFAKIEPFNSTTKGMDIQRHLEKIYDDLITESYGTRVQ